MNRTHRLRESLPVIVASANYSPPVEIVVLDYSSSDALQEYLREYISKGELQPPNFWTLKTITGEKFYWTSRARNVSILASSGEYFVQLNTEALPEINAIAHIRDLIEKHHPVWMCDKYMGTYVVCRKDEFVSAGGYDERFDVYGPEDRDICARLHRRGGSFLTFPPHLIREIYTPNDEKTANMDKSRFDGKIWIKRQMSRAMREIYEENSMYDVLVANEGREWGK
jgi:hypothetical protein